MPRTRNWLPWVLLAAVYVLLVTISWHRWVNPIVDCGREMYVPWQISEGKMLYRDLFFMYGPFVPYWHALLFEVFGTHLNVLYAVGLTLVAVHAGLVFVIARRLLSPSLALLAAMLFLVQFAFRPTLSNLVFPYSFNAGYACALNLLALWLVLRHSEDKSPVTLIWAGICVGLSLLSKQEIGLAGFLFLVSYLFAPIDGRRSAISHSLLALAPAVLVPLLGYGGFAAKLGPTTLLHDYLWPREILAQMKFFEQYVVGTLFAPRAVLYLARLALLGTSVLLVILFGAWAANRYVHRSAGVVWIFLVALLLIISNLSDPFFRFVELNQIYAGNFLFLVVALVVAIRSRPTLLWITLFALFSTWRAPLFAGISAYSSFFMATSIIVFVWLWTEWIPKLWPSIDIVIWQRHAAIAFAILCVLHIGRTVVVSHTQLTWPLSTTRGSMIVHRDIGPTLKETVDLILSQTQPGEPLLLFPEETSLYFLCDRRSPSKYYQFAPALIANEEKERQLIQDADAAKVRFVTVSNRATTEYGKPYFGIDYYPHIREWLLSNFHLVKTIGNPIRAVPPPPPSRFWPNDGYGIEIYERN